jgi:tRNA(Ile)-lysidine synthase
MRVPQENANIAKECGLWTMNLSEHIVEFLRRHDLEYKPGVVAVSGGPDSVALAHACVTLLRGDKLPGLVLAHVNHLLRGEESDDDEAFVQQLPALWQMADDVRLQCRTTRIDVAGIAAAEGGNLEGTARRERYAWLSRLAHDEGAAWIATGHSADDQAETVLFRLLRGSGVLGLGGMSERRLLGPGVSLIRPLLTVRRQALLDHLSEKQIAFRRDSSNRDPRFTRNRLRLELLPMLEADFNPGVVDVLCRLAIQAQELSDEITTQAEKLRAEAELPRAGVTLVFSAVRLQTASANLVREMFRLVWHREGWPMGDMDFERWNRLVEIVHGSLPACDFPGKIHARRVGGVIQLNRPTD